VLVTPADVPDSDAADELIPAAKAVAPPLQLVWADGASDGDWAAWAREEQPVTVAVVRRPADLRGFVVQARRWVVERSIAWYSRNRRLSRDFELYETTSETFIYLASCRMLIRRLRPIPNY
jgi:putative transposase